MTVLDRIRAAWRSFTGRRGFASAGINRLTSSWSSSIESADATLRYSLSTLRGRSRDLAINNVYVKRYLQLMQDNVVGPVGIRLQAAAVTPRGKVDSSANAKIEAAWDEWGQPGICEVTGRLSWKDCQDLVVECLKRDGECLVIKHSGRSVNRFGFALQFLDADHLDENYNESLANGNTIRMGVEQDSWGRPVAYWLRVRHPGDLSMPATSGRGDVYYRQRYDASRILHIYKTDRPGQTRGYPALSASMARINMLGAAEEAELTGWRAASAKMGFITSPDSGKAYLGDGKDTQGNIISEVEPGSIELLPAGYDFKPFDPGYPNANIEQFSKYMLRGIASDAGISYVSLANDLEGVNYSSIRQGVLDERSRYITEQNFLISALLQPVFEEWLLMSLGRVIVLPVDKYLQFSKCRWQGRRWSWVDPLKDIKASEVELANGLTSRTRIAAEQGKDLEDIFAELQREQEMARQYNITLIDPLPSGVKQDPAGPGGAADGDEEP